MAGLPIIHSFYTDAVGAPQAIKGLPSKTEKNRRALKKRRERRRRSADRRREVREGVLVSLSGHNDRRKRRDRRRK